MPSGPCSGHRSSRLVLASAFCMVQTLTCCFWLLKDDIPTPASTSPLYSGCSAWLPLAPICFLMLPSFLVGNEYFYALLFVVRTSGWGPCHSILTLPYRQTVHHSLFPGFVSAPQALLNWDSFLGKPGCQMSKYVRGWTGNQFYEKLCVQEDGKTPSSCRPLTGSFLPFTFNTS